MGGFLVCVGLRSERVRGLCVGAGLGCGYGYGL
jgi:hypothetical protein